MLLGVAVSSGVLVKEEAMLSSRVSQNGPVNWGIHMTSVVIVIMASPNIPVNESLTNPHEVMLVTNLSINSWFQFQIKLNSFNVL